MRILNSCVMNFSIFAFALCNPFLMPIKEAKAYPLLQNLATLSLAQSGADTAVVVLPSSEDPNLFYIPPRRLMLQTDAETGQPAFRLNYSREKGAEFSAIFRLSFHDAPVLAAWKTIQEQNPHARMRALPIHKGRLAVELQGEGRSILLAESEPIESEFPLATLPFYVRMTPESLDFLRIQMQMPGQLFLALRFRYESRAAFDLEPINFRVVPQDFVRTMRSDERLQAKWQLSDLLPTTILRSYVSREFRKSWRTDDDASDVNLKLLAPLFQLTFEKYLAQDEEQPSHIGSLKALEVALSRNLSSEHLTLTSPTQREVLPISSSAGILLQGLCSAYPTLVYEEETGIANCLEFPLRDIPVPAPEEEEQPWLPVFRRP